MTERARVCFVGNPNMGSVMIRGKQLAAMRPQWSWVGAQPGPETFAAFDVFVFVKRPQRRLMRTLRRLGKAVVLDVLDYWAQPEERPIRHRVASRRHFDHYMSELFVDAVVFPNIRMRDDLGDLVPAPRTLYHHYWPGQTPIEVRQEARVIGYQGEARYLGPWRPALEAACRRLGLELRLNPVSLRELDIGVAMRGGPHRTYRSEHYKSNVKLANFYGAALPCLVNPEASYEETDCGAVRFCAQPDHVEEALRELLPYETRLEIHQAFLGARERYEIGAIADDYERILTDLWRSVRQRWAA